MPDLAPLTPEEQAAAESEHTAVDGVDEWWCLADGQAWPCFTKRALATIRGLRAALQTYGRHRDGCEPMEPSYHCACGLAAALEGRAPTDEIRTALAEAREALRDVMARERRAEPGLEGRAP